MKPMLWFPLAIGVVLAPNASRCSRPPDPHKGEVAWIGADGELVVAPGYVITTAGDCAALAGGPVDSAAPPPPPIAWEDAQHCFKKLPTP